jgi:lysozyme
MAFQMGTKGLLAFRRTLGSIEDGQYSEAALEMLDSTWAKQTPARAMRLATQMETDQWQ